jgi:hypothetical protein
MALHLSNALSRIKDPLERLRPRMVGLREDGDLVADTPSL